MYNYVEEDALASFIHSEHDNFYRGFGLSTTTLTIYFNVNSQLPIQY